MVFMYMLIVFCLWVGCGLWAASLINHSLKKAGESGKSLITEEDLLIMMVLGLGVLLLTLYAIVEDEITAYKNRF